ncbi:hypothetical protein [Sphingomonas gei]|uniref:hypothetical protein n=1 Tax=Sphingomonas gei TaxID=1395960 RepID=UPI0019D29AA8|nr:hypothetical protein [Sphingomonas gei]
MAIGAPVGRGATNALADVIVIQHLLNDWLADTRQTLLPTTGNCGPLTIAAIEAFQTRVLGATNPDARIDPGGRTWNALSTRAAGAPAPTAALSGGTWWHANQANFPNSAAIGDLVPAFRDAVTAFVGALKAAGATVKVSATRRNRTRAQLMHYSWRIAHGSIAPKDVPAIPGCAIAWDHGNLAASKQGAQEMVDLFGIAFQPSLTSRHIEGRAIDMTIGWAGTIQLSDKTGRVRPIGAPRAGDTNRDLHAIGATYGVIKLASDPPHWSDDGH